MTQTIRSDGTYYNVRLLKPGSAALLELCGSSFGGGTATVGFKAADGAFSPYRTLAGAAVTMTARGGLQVCVPRNGQVGISLAGSSNPSMVLDIIAVDDPECH
jgi:hypothetical protein